MTLENAPTGNAAACGSRLPVGTPQLRGATDLLGAYLGPAALCLAARDAPDSVRAAVETSITLCSEVARRQARWASSCCNGYFNAFEIWAPGTTLVWSADLATLFSLRMYRELFLPFDRALAAAVAHPVLHLHTGSLRLFDVWGALPELAVQVALDPVGPPLTAVLPVLARLQPGRPLIFQVQNMHELAQAQAALSPRGLHLASRWPAGRPPPADDPRFGQRGS